MGKLFFISLIVSAIFLFIACNNDDDDDDNSDISADDDDDNADDDDTDDDDDGWIPVDENGDAVSDATSDETDIVQLWYRTDGTTLEMDLEFQNGYNPETAYIEVYLFHPDSNELSHTVMLKEGKIFWWNCDCSSAKDKHSGCHWGTVAKPESLTTDTTQSGHFSFTIAIDDLGFSDPSIILTGAGAAPETIEASADYADRYPDALWLTSTEVTGLAQISLETN